MENTNKLTMDLSEELTNQTLSKSILESADLFKNDPYDTGMVFRPKKESKLFNRVPRLASNQSVDFLQLRRESSGINPLSSLIKNRAHGKI